MLVESIVLTISMSVAVVGFWSYVREMLNDRITMRTKWSDLTMRQAVYAAMWALGVIASVISLIMMV